MGCLGTLLQYTYAVKYRRGGTAGLESPAKDTSPKARKTRITGWCLALIWFSLTPGELPMRCGVRGHLGRLPSLT
jgi:hypothetical protein